MLRDDAFVKGKDIEKIFNSSTSLSKKLAANTRKFYGKSRGESITLSQVRKANNLNP